MYHLWRWTINATQIREVNYTTIAIFQSPQKIKIITARVYLYECIIVMYIYEIWVFLPGTSFSSTFKCVIFLSPCKKITAYSHFMHIFNFFLCMLCYGRWFLWYFVGFFLQWYRSCVYKIKKLKWKASCNDLLWYQTRVTEAYKGGIITFMISQECLFNPELIKISSIQH